MGTKGRKVQIAIFVAILALGFIGAFFVSLPKVKASDNHVVINEIYPAPLSSCDQGVDPDCVKEWVELYNPTNNIIDLADYVLSDGDGNTKTFSSSDTITSQKYFVLFTTTRWLNNNGDKIFLKLKNSSSIIDQASFGDWPDGNSNDNALKPANGQSISRIPNGQDTDIDADDFQIVPITKGGENILPPLVVYSDEIIINEILPEPATGSDDEYIELFNTGENEVDLSDWRLDDSTAGSEYVIPNGTKIASHQYLAFCKDSNALYCDFNHKKIALNDTSSDYAVLIDPNGDIKYQVPAYQKAIRGRSYSKFGDIWEWTTEITPKGENIFREEIIMSDEDLFVPEIPISQARKLSSEETVKVTGTVSVLPGKLSSQYFYIEDEGGGIQIYSYHKVFPFLRLGDVVSALGELAEYKNEKRIKIVSESDIQIISSRSPPEAEKVKIDDLSEGLEGQYISVVGIVTKTSGNVFYIHGSGEIQVSIREGTGIKKPKMRVGDKVEVAGILSQYGDYYRILPTR